LIKRGLTRLAFSAPFLTEKKISMPGALLLTATNHKLMTAFLSTIYSLSQQVNCGCLKIRTSLSFLLRMKDICEQTILPYFIALGFYALDMLLLAYEHPEKKGSDCVITENHLVSRSI
jgi:hypothetical protein